MLLELRVRDIGIIEDIAWSLGPGLNIITGETGAGKSLVVDAIEVLLGGRLDEEMVRHGAEEARIEGVFALPRGGCGALAGVLEERGVLAGAEDNLVITCQLRRQGRSVIRLNGQAVPRSFLQQVGGLLVDIHGQSDHLSLLDRRRHLAYLDGYAGTGALRQGFAALVADLQRLEGEMRALQQDEREAARRQDFLRYQVEEIAAAGLRPGEDDELEQERRVLASAERLKAAAFEACQLVQGEDAAGPATLDRLHVAAAGLRRLVELDPALGPLLESLEAALYGLEEAARDIRRYAESLEDNPARLAEVAARLELIADLKRKYGPSIADILAHGEQAAAELETISHSAGRLRELEARVSELRYQMGQAAAELSEQRQAAAVRLAEDVEAQLRDLGLEAARFQVVLERREDPGGIPLPDGQTCAFSPDGVDLVEFYVSANPGEPLRPLVRTASTGEMSRFMLAIKTVLAAADDIPVLVFDEIDIGVGGRSGEVIGRKLWDLSRHRQTICVTHLPQIAAFADAHYRVLKEVAGGRSVSRLETLDEAARIEELAAMLAGSAVTGAARRHARELLESARAWKEPGR